MIAPEILRFSRRMEKSRFKRAKLCLIQRTVKCQGKNQRAREHELKLIELFMSQRQPAVSYSAGSSSIIFPGRSPSPFAGSSHCAGSSSMISPERSPSPFAYTAQDLIYKEPRQCQFSESEGTRYHQF